MIWTTIVLYVSLFCTQFLKCLKELSTINYMLIFSATKFLALINVVFQKCHSMEWAAICVQNTTQGNIDQGRLTGVLFIALWKAFDNVNHEVWLKVNMSGSETIYRTVGV